MPDSDQHHAELRAYLAERDVPCPGCGYNLRGVAEPVCPECGRAIEIEDIYRMNRQSHSTGRRRGWLFFLGTVLVGGLIGAMQVHHYYRNEQLFIVFTTLAVTLVPALLSEMLWRRSAEKPAVSGGIVAQVVFLSPILILLACVVTFAIRFGRFW